MVREDTTGLSTRRLFVFWGDLLLVLLFLNGPNLVVTVISLSSRRRRGMRVT